ncbi:LysR family transcriptional regulator [Polymorphobacter sp. PAMC 29334]|uniref:LysR substrate-binding domain-containing protein n=1 Tax=Polymorphobacter sp. PAMC 29334 TaxID=2862331 RepID=UPI001C756C18|nr:LysR substrate-binding domain-containing protein [Polymorphobacter sp. PAMC 29334]QYE36380.1 LysR family transcriptional regulator [Polymorphobacter sp. PAMC 29334]
MLDLNDFRYFVRVVDGGGLTAASRAMNVPKSTLGHRLQQLETSLGVRLINRTSRSQSVTDAGALFYRHAIDMLHHADLAENLVRQRLTEPSGLIKYTTAVATSLFALRLIVPAFVRDHPKIKMVQHISDEQIDIVGGSYDLAIRAHGGPLSDSGLVQRVLARGPWLLFASPAYLQLRGQPHTPEDLSDHDLIMMLSPGHSPTWRLLHAEMGERAFPVDPRIAGNDLVMLKQVALDGIGIAALPAFICHIDERDGTLVQVLPGWRAGEASITAVLPFRDGVLPSVRVFLDHLARELPKVLGPVDRR